MDNYYETSKRRGLCLIAATTTQPATRPEPARPMCCWREQTAPALHRYLSGVACFVRQLPPSVTANFCALALGETVVTQNVPHNMSHVAVCVRHARYSLYNGHCWSFWGVPEPRSCGVKVEVAVLGSPSLILVISLMVSVEVKQHKK